MENGSLGALLTVAVILIFFSLAYPVITPAVIAIVFGVFPVLWMARIWKESMVKEADDKKNRKLEKEMSYEEAAMKEVYSVLPSRDIGYLGEIFQKFYAREAVADTYYTNSEFGEKMSLFMPKLDEAMEIYGRLVKSDEFSGWDVPEAVRGVDTPYNMYRGYKKGFDGEDRVRRVLLDNGVKFMESVNLRNGDFQIEVDFMMLVGNNVVTLEVKDYAAEEIILDDSGELYKVVNGKEVPVENVLNQINRHRKFIKENFPKGVKVVNLIVLSDRGTVVKNRIREEDIRIVVPEYVVNIVDKLSNEDKNTENEVRKIIEELRASERRFKFFNIEALNRELDELYFNKDSKFNRLVEGFDKEGNYEKLVERFETKFRELSGYCYRESSVEEGRKRHSYAKIRRRIEAPLNVIYNREDEEYEPGV